MSTSTKIDEIPPTPKTTHEDEVQEVISKLKQGLHLPYPRIIKVIETLQNERNELAFLEGMFNPSYVTVRSNTEELDRLTKEAINIMDKSFAHLSIIPVMPPEWDERFPFKINTKEPSPWHDFLMSAGISGGIVLTIAGLLVFCSRMEWF